MSYRDSMKDIIHHNPGRNAENPRPRHSLTFQSSVFGSDIQDQRSASPFKPRDNIQALGMDKPDYPLKRAVEEAPFVPKYADSSAANRRLFEFYGNCYPCEQLKEAPRPNPQTARERKEFNLVSSLAPVVAKQPQVQRTKETPQEYSPERRKEQILSSDVLGGSPYRYERREHLKENVEQRKQHHLYSDIFGEPRERATREYKKPIKQEFHNARTSKQRDLAGDKGRSFTPMVPTKTEAPQFTDKPVTASLMKARELCTTYQSYQEPMKVEPHLVHLKLTKVPTDFSEHMIRTICPTVHIVSCSLDMNNITGKCTGTGMVSLRSAEVNKDVTTFRYALMERNIEATKHEENLGRKNNYSGMSSVHWLDPKLERPKTAERGARECKINNLESSKDLFGDVGRWGENWKQQRHSSAIDKQFIAEAQWINTLNARKLF